MYALGIDLGTTFTAAATWRQGRAEIAELGSRAAAIPSVVLLREDETVLTGETANRRGITEPHRVAREFKRRLGDTTPILLGGVPYSAEALMGRLLRSVIDEVARREGGQPSAICVSHPANWGPYKKDLLHQAARLADVEQPVTFTTEPEAAAAFYARQQRIEPGAVVAVYDLGGGTFDAAVLRKTAGGFEILGQPEGIERLGGIDFDAAVFHHVSQALGGKLAELDEDDPAAVAAVARLREECVAAKEALSSDTDATIPVLLPNLATEVRLTRAELEAMVRPALFQTIEAMRRALRSAAVAPDQLHAVLLVGGSSRMPLVAQLVGAELGRPVTVDAHPKHAVALGAAGLAGGADPAAPAATGEAPATSPAAAGAGPTGPLAGRTIASAAVRPASSAPPPAPPVLQPVAPAPAAQAPPVPVQTTRGAGVRSAPAAVARSAVPAPVPPATTVVTTVDGAAPGVTPPRRRLPLLVAGAAVGTLLVAGGIAWAVIRPGGDEDPDLIGLGDTASESPSPSPSPSETVPLDEQCTDEIKRNERWVCLTSATLTGHQLVIEYDAEWAGSVPDVSGGYHVHIYGGDGTTPADEVMGTQAEDRGQWKIRDASPAILDAQDIADVIGDYPKVCARIANGAHELTHALDGGYATGNCVPIEPG